MDERRAGGAGRLRRAQRPHRRRLRRRSRRLGSGRRVDRRCVAAAAAAQADTLRGPRAARRGARGVSSWRVRVGRRPARARKLRTAPMTATFLDLVDLASERFGGAAVAANDEFFAPKENLIRPGPAIWREGEYTERGKWMDGWETRRRRDGGDRDWCIVRLGVR